MPEVAQAPAALQRHAVCAGCSTELAAHALECPVCHQLVHGDRLKSLAARAEACRAAGAAAAERSAWEEALALLPATSRQHQAITTRVAELERADLTRSDRKDFATPSGGRPWWRSVGAGALGLALLLGGKFKFLLLGLTKAKTFLSMFAFFGVYWTAFGWPVALGLVVGIYIHEMGHVAMLRRLGIGAGAPLFIPGVGAFVMLKRPVTDPRQDAAIGLAGPVWGLGAALAAFGVHGATGEPIWLAIAQLTAFINLFNLIPIWQLDGARGFHALTRLQRWGVTVAMAVACAATGQKLLIVVAGVAAWSAFRRAPGPGDSRALVTFLGLVAVLSWLSVQLAV